MNEKGLGKSVESDKQNDIHFSQEQVPVFDEHKGNADCVSEVPLRGTTGEDLSSPVQNPRCHCEDKKRRGGMGVQVNCSRCGGAL